MASENENRTTELQSLLKLKNAGRLRYWHGTIEIPETELHAICDEIQTEHEQAIAATLGSSTLTAEQIEKAIHDCSTYASYDGCTYYASGMRLQAITDELNTMLGSGTCKITATATSNLMYPDYMTKWYELSCGHSMTLKGEEVPKCCAVCWKAVKQ